MQSKHESAYLKIPRAIVAVCEEECSAESLPNFQKEAQTGNTFERGKSEKHLSGLVHLFDNEAEVTWHIHHLNAVTAMLFHASDGFRGR